MGKAILSLKQSKSNNATGSFLDSIAKVAQQEIADSRASNAFYHVPPTGSVKLPLPQGYPAGLPYWMLTPKNELKIYPTPFGRKLSDSEMLTVLNALQPILNTAVKPAPNVFTYIEPKTGWSFAKEIQRTLPMHEGDPIMFSLGNNFLTAYAGSVLNNQQKDVIGGIGKGIMAVVAAIPILGTVAKLVSTKSAADAQADILNSVANSKSILSAGILQDQSANGTVTDAQKEMIVFAVIAVIIIVLIVILIKK